MNILFDVLDWVNAIVLVYFIVLNGSYLLTAIVSQALLWRYARRLKTVDVEDLMGSAAAPPITLLVPAFNEETTCVESVRSLLTLRYHDYEILFVNDGSKDRTLALMTEAFDLQPVPRAPMHEVAHQPVRAIYRSRSHPSLWVLDKENGGAKADANNAGIAYCRTPLFCALDADSVLERDGLMRVVRPFLEDRTTIAVGGNIRIINGCTVRDGAVVDVRLPRSLFARYQVLEYLRAFLTARVGWAEFGTTFIISGAFGAFHCETVVAAGGYRADSLAEDMELVLRLHRYCRDRGIRYRIDYVADPVVWTECPEDYATLARQRRRWQRGLGETLMVKRFMLFNPKYGAVGMVGFPNFFILEMMGPVVEAVGFAGFIVTILLGHATTLYSLAFFAVAFVLGAALSVAAIALEELTFHRYARWQDLAGLFVLGFTEVLFYRELNAWWRVQGTWEAIRGKQSSWGVMKRKGFAAK